MRWFVELQFGIRLQIFKDILKRWWWGYWFHHTEAQTMGLMGLEIGILANDDYFDILDWGYSKSIEY
jgi:hypothetical protein